MSASSRLARAALGLALAAFAMAPTGARADEALAAETETGMTQVTVDVSGLESAKRNEGPLALTGDVADPAAAVALGGAALVALGAQVAKRR